MPRTVPAPRNSSVVIPRTVKRSFAIQSGRSRLISVCSPRRSAPASRSHRIPSNTVSAVAFQYVPRGALTRRTSLPSRGQSIGPYSWSQANLWPTSGVRDWAISS